MLANTNCFGHHSWRKVALPAVRPALRTSFYRHQVGQTSHRGIYAGLRQWDGSLIDLQNRCRQHPSSSCLFAMGEKNPKGYQWKKDKACTSEILFNRLPPVNYLHSSSGRPIIPLTFCAPCQSGSTFNLPESLWHLNQDLPWGLLIK